jgi:hypothetical protein
MPIMWFAKDGPRPNSQSGPGVPITTSEAQAIVGGQQIKFVGLEAPSINSETPSGSLKNVVLEIDSDLDVSTLLPKVGFYFVMGLSPLEAERQLNACRGSA